MADQRYYNMNGRSEDNRYRINNNLLRMMNANPYLGTGYIIGSMLGENYWGKKRAKREKIANRIGRGEDGSIGADANGTYGVNNATPTQSSSKNPGYYDSMNKALEEYRNTPNGNVLYSGSGNGGGNSNSGVYIDTANGIYPQTPQQANKPAVTLENVGNGGGTQGVMDAWNNMANASAYNPGNTAMYTNGARNLGNVIGADANGVYGVGGNGAGAPSVANFPQKPANGPAPYTDDQLRQIAAQNFTPDEQSRMMTANERARMEALMAPPPQASAPSGGGYTVSNEATPVAPANPAPTGDEMRLIKGDAPAPEAYDYVPGYTNPQDMDNLAWDRGNYNALARAKENLGVFGQALARIPEFFNGQQKARDRWNNRK